MESIQREGLNDSVAFVLRWILRELEHVHPEKIILNGVGQGGATALTQHMVHYRDGLCWIHRDILRDALHWGVGICNEQLLQEAGKCGGQSFRATSRGLGAGALCGSLDRESDARVIAHTEMASRTPIFLTQSADDWLPSGLLRHFKVQGL